MDGTPVLVVLGGPDVPGPVGRSEDGAHERARGRGRLAVAGLLGSGADQCVGGVVGRVGEPTAQQVIGEPEGLHRAAGGAVAGLGPAGGEASGIFGTRHGGAFLSGGEFTVCRRGADNTMYLRY
jgi:hypothetical protein